MTDEKFLHTLHEATNTAVSTISSWNFSDIAIEERLRLVSDCPMFSFWTEVRDSLKSGYMEIERLNAKIAELEKKI
jgi:hypothetical protein